MITEHLNPFSSNSSKRKRIFLHLSVFCVMSSLQSKQMKCPQGFNFLKDATSSLKQTGQGSRFVIFVFSSCILVGSVRFILVCLLN